MVVRNVASIPSTKTVTLIPGDGVFPEIFMSVKYIFREAGIPVVFEEIPLRFNIVIFICHSSELPGRETETLDHVVESVSRNKVCLKGVIKASMGSAIPEALSIRLRRALDLYASVAQIRSLDGVRTRHNDLDFLVVREMLEGEYSALEHQSIPGVVESLKIITRRNSERIAKFAFDYAQRHGRKKVTAVHKANIMKIADGLFLETCSNVAKLYPSIEFESMIVDNCCMQLVSRPAQFDVMVMPNLYGAIVENVSSGIVGGAGLVPSVLYSHDVAIFEPGAKHTFSQSTGRNVANPTALLLCASSLLRHINLDHYANRLEAALFRVIRTGHCLTPDLGGCGTTTEFSHSVLQEMLRGK
ncbi:unnamed protein product [Mesocestoides corti]|uniref:Isocitric dehydrogenase subunit beta n=2 Tax=Mesocestoides corti TaxID=53468 RepID=A0A0R3U149_MESCO|nr:unnamed protein product [Mesocestoides corti]